MLIKKIPVKALIIFFIGAFLGFATGSKYAAKSIVKIFDTKSVSQALNKTTQHNVNNNVVEVKKLKVKNSDSVVFGFKPITEQKNEQTTQIDSCKIIYDKYKTLSKSKRKRFEKW